VGRVHLPLRAVCLVLAISPYIHVQCDKSMYLKHPLSISMHGLYVDLFHSERDKATASVIYHMLRTHCVGEHIVWMCFPTGERPWENILVGCGAPTTRNEGPFAHKNNTFLTPFFDQHTCHEVFSYCPFRVILDQCYFLQN
jgi:hypothetical protein